MAHSHPQTLTVFARLKASQGAGHHLKIGASTLWRQTAVAWDSYVLADTESGAREFNLMR